MQFCVIFEMQSYLHPPWPAFSGGHLKVVYREKLGGSGRWLRLSISLGH